MRKNRLNKKYRDYTIIRVHHAIGTKYKDSVSGIVRTFTFLYSIKLISFWSFLPNRHFLLVDYNARDSKILLSRARGFRIRSRLNSEEKPDRPNLSFLDDNRSTCCARLCSSCVMAVLRSVLAIGDVLAAQLRGVAYAAVEVSVVVLLATLPDPPVAADPYDTVDAGSQDDVDKEDDVDAESLLQDDSRLDSVSVEPVLPIDIVLPICMPMAFIGLVSART